MLTSICSFIIVGIRSFPPSPFSIYSTYLLVLQHERILRLRANDIASHQSQRFEGVGQAVLVNVGGGEVAEGLDAMNGVAHGYGCAGGFEHGGVVVGVADGDGVGNGIAQQRSHVAHSGTFVDAVDEQFAVIRRDLVV